MINSIKIVDNEGAETVLQGPGRIEIVPGPGISVIPSGNSISIDADTSIIGDTPYSRLFDEIVDGTIKLPYISAISGVKPDINGNLWLLGGKTSQVSYTTDTFTISDMGQTVDYPRIYRSVYAMLRQIRLWLDAHKDTLLLTKGNADSWWERMKNDQNDWKPLESDYSKYYFEESRPRDSIADIGDATNMISQYMAVVALWNYIVNQPLANYSARLHPADSAGVYIGADINIPRTTDGEFSVDVEFTIEISTQQAVDGMRVWLRMPILSCEPNDNDKVKLSNIIVNGTEHTPSESGASVLDSGVHIDWPEGGTISVSYTITMPAEDTSANMYTTHAVIEAIPYMVCPYDGEEDEGEKGLYSTAKKSPRESSAGEATWTISCTVTSNGVPVNPIEPQIEKKTTYVNTCISDDEDSKE